MRSALTPSHLRNFAIVGHQASGKTMLSEAMLLCAGQIHRLGSIEAGTTVSDYHESEKERHISVHASLMNCPWMERHFNIVDTPGYLDFISEGLGALRVGDFALVVVHAVNGVELGTTQVWDYASQYGIPKMIVVNGADRENTDFDGLLEDLRQNLGARILPLSLPINPGPGFNRVLDVMRSEEIVYERDGSGRFAEKAAEGPWKERVRTLHQQLIEFVAESDNGLLETFFNQGDLTEEQLRAGVHAAIQSQSFVPVYVTSATKNIGVARLMDFIAKYGSSPVDRADVPARNERAEEVQVALGDAEPTCYIFKTLVEPHVGELSFCRMYSGSIHSGMEMWNSDRQKTEKLGALYRLQGHQRQPVEVLGPGDIGVMAKLRDTHTGNTLSSPSRHVTLPAVRYPHPNVHGALRVASRGDEDKLAEGLATLHEEDPTFLYRHDPETHQTVISGQGELHLEVIRGRLRRRFHVDIELVPPRIPFRETIRGSGEARHRHKKQTGGAGQFAEVWMRIEPLPRNEGLAFTESLVGQDVDRVFVPSVEKGVQAACMEGILAGCRITDLKVNFFGGKMHPVDSKDIAFQIAGREAFRQAFQAARPCLLEPIINLEIRVPEGHVGDILGDLSGRRGRILGLDSDGKFQLIRAQAPQMEIYRYSTVLRSLTGGRGLHQETFSHYEELPPNLEARVLNDLRHDRERLSA